MMTTTGPGSGADGSDAYGLGHARYATKDGRVAREHGGAIGGYVTEVCASRDGATVAVFAENASRTDRTMRVRRRASETLFDAAPP